jgi:sugar phosphate isomerase/epimerase
MRIFAGGTAKGNTDAEAAAWTVECIEACTQKCTERGVFLALEDHGGFTGKIDSLLELVAKVKNPWFALNVDTGNFADADPFASIKKAAPYAVTAHLKADMSVAGKRGPADFEKIIAALREGNYRGYIALEYESQEDPKTAVPRILETMQKLLG